jgi:hypothetical protein
MTLMIFRSCFHLIRLLPVVFVLVLGSCAMQSQWKEAAPETVFQQQTGGMPYHPLVYHLDLCVLSYQLYSQTLAWPFDPYYEDLDNMSWDRTKFMKKVHDWAVITGQEQVRTGTGLSSYRGPGVLGGFDNNLNHDPILFRYDLVYPWSDTATNPAGRWTEYLTPKRITGQVRDVYVCYRTTGGKKGDVVIERLPTRNRSPTLGARDVILAFEGGTGDKGEPGQPSSQSLMGFVLLRHKPGGNYDLHITFRGSRSGSAGRALLQGNWTGGAKGNPDWITDLGYTYLDAEEGTGHISERGKVSRGFAKSMEEILPPAMRCMKKVAQLESGRRPDRIYVTGHSLGGALAQHFVSAVLMGDRYGPDGAGAAMPAALRAWPWKEIKLLTFGSPRAGNAEWARALTEEHLDSEAFSTWIDPYDRSALPVAHPSIVPRLMDKDRPAAYRVLLTQDPISTSKVIGGKHVGKSVYIDKPSVVNLFAAWSKDAHEPIRAREHMLNSLSDARIPPIAWRYQAMTEMNPDRKQSKRGSVGEYEKLKIAVEHYYRSNGQWFEQASFEKNYQLYKTLLQSP